MFLPINTTKTYLSVGDCVDGLKGQKLHDICQKIAQTRSDTLKQFQQSTIRKRILADEISLNIDEFLENKHAISKKFAKNVFNLMESRKIEGEHNHFKFETVETEEIRKDFRKISDLIKNSMPVTNK